MKVKSVRLTGICMAMRDKLLQDATSLSIASEKSFEQAELQCKQIMASAKEAVHAARIQVNRMKKEASMIQEALNEELELQVKEEQAAQEAWEVKSTSHLKAELETDDCLMDLLKKVN